jgi:hypothetical protein
MTLEIQERQKLELVPNRINPNEFIGYQNPDDPINLLEIELIKHDPVACPVTHKFTPNLYTREIFMPKNTLVTSLLHLTTHPFFILQGDVSVWYHDVPVQRYKAPYSGITKAGTRRLLYTHEDTIWAACFVTTLTDPEEIAEEIMAHDFNPHIDRSNPRMQTWKCNRIET